MTLFEYLAIAFSLVFSFTAMRLVAGLPHAVRADRRYWVHLVLVALQLLATALLFWIFWSYREVEWSFPFFLLALANPSIVYFNACTLMPESSGSVESWRDHYFEVCGRYYLGVSLWAVIAGLSGMLVLGLPFLHPVRFFQVLFVVIGIIGATSKNERIHAVLATSLLLISIGVTFLVFSAPGALG